MTIGDAQLAARQALLSEDAMRAHIRACACCQLAYRLKLASLICPPMRSLARRFMRSLSAALYYRSGT